MRAYSSPITIATIIITMVMMAIAVGKGGEGDSDDDADSWLVVGFLMSLQHLRSYQDWYQLVSACIYGECMIPCRFCDFPLGNTII